MMSVPDVPLPEEEELLPSTPYFVATVEGLGIKVRAKTFEELREGLLQKVEYLRDKNFMQAAELNKVYSDLLKVSPQRGLGEGI